MRLRVDGREIYCHTGGVPFDPRRLPVVLIHGAGMEHSVWRFQARALAHSGFGVLAPDLPGHGRSVDPAATSIEDMSAFIEALLDELAIERAAVAGHSMGSLIALEVAASFPERVEKMVLVCPSGDMQVHPELLSLAEAGDRTAVSLMVGWIHSGPLKFGGRSEPGGWSPGMTARMLEAGLRRSLASDLKACAAYQGLERASLVRCPTMVIAGGRDLMTPARAAKELAEAIPGAVCRVLSEAGHGLLAEEPERVRRILEEFLPPARS